MFSNHFAMKIFPSTMRVDFFPLAVSLVHLVLFLLSLFASIFRQDERKRLR